MSGLEQFQVSGNAAEHYERYIVPTIFVLWATDLLERAALQSGERVLDVACGTGVVRHAAQQVGNDGKVTGIDLNSMMLKVARVQAASSSAVVEWHQGDAGALPFEDVSRFVRKLPPNVRLYRESAFSVWVYSANIPYAFMRPAFRAYIHGVAYPKQGELRHLDLLEI